MSERSRRVALLARPGVACERMREALVEARAEIVFEADPTVIDETTLLAAKPEVVLVMLDAATENAFERFDSLLGDPSIEVLFEEAELAASREGWDKARWVRHLSAKLHHHADVLPPGREPDVIAPVDVHAAMDLVSVELGDEAATYTREHAADTTARTEKTFEASPSQASPFELSLVDDDDGASGKITVEGHDAAADDTAETTYQFQNDMDDLHQRIASMQLVDDKQPSPVRGAVLVLAGIGGPDAVRQLLGALPENFPRPVLVQQRLDGGRYDKLVAQMQRATTLPVQLAEPGQPAQAPAIYILSPSVGVQVGASGLAFTDTPADLLASLPAGDSAVLLLSGSDAEQIDEVMKYAIAGAMVAGQSPDGCYDAAAPTALAGRGGEIGTPTDLAKLLAKRWPSPGAHSSLVL